MTEITATTLPNPTWHHDAVMYAVEPGSYFDANDDGIGDFRGLLQKLEYIEDLGVNALILPSVYPTHSLADRSGATAFTEVDPRHGPVGDFALFLKEAHRRGIKLLIGLTINHTSDLHPWFQAARRAPPHTSKRNFYVWSDDDQKYHGTQIITGTEVSNWAWNPVAKAYYWHRFSFDQPDLNFDNPNVLKAVFRAIRFWLDMGVDGFQLDAIPYLVEREGTNNENLPETHSVIKRILAAIDAKYPDRLLFADIAQLPEDVRDYFGDGDECHMVYDYSLVPRMYMAIAQEDRHPIIEIVAGLVGYGQSQY